jgi:hypothetical protein
LAERGRVDPEDLVHRRRELGPEDVVAVVAVAAAGGVRERPVVGDVAGRLLEVGGEAPPLELLGEDVRDPLGGDVSPADLGDRVVAIAQEDPLVEPRRPLPLGPVEGAPGVGDVGGELLEEEAADGSRVARVAGEERALDGLRQVDQGEDRPVEVGEVGGEEGPLLLCEFLDRVAHRAILAIATDAPGRIYARCAARTMV